MGAYFLLYDIISIIIGTSATLFVLVLYIKTRNQRLVSYLLTTFFVALIVVAITLDYFYIIMDQESLMRNIIWQSIQFSCCGLCFWIPRTCRHDPPGPGERVVERVFGASALILAFLLAANFLFLGSIENVFFIFLYSLIYIDLSLVCVYFGLNLLKERNKGLPDRQLRHYHEGLHFTGLVVLIMLPFFVITDFFGWLLPFFRDYVDRSFTLIPAFYILMSVRILLGAVLEILEPAGELAPVEPDDTFITKYGLTRREAEIAPLVLRCLTYKQIGERLFISPGTVRTHLIHIYAKTGTRNRLELSSLIQTDRGKLPGRNLTR